MIIVHQPRQGVLPREMSAEQLTRWPFNGGLVHARLLGLPPEKAPPRNDEEPAPRKAADTFREAFAAIGPTNQARLDAAHRRLDGLGGVKLGANAGEGWDHWFLDVRTESRLAVGLGNEHPLENGLSFHHTLGVPYVPGTAVKGALRAWAELRGTDEAELDRWLGRGAEAEGDERDRIGGLSVLDALPLEWPGLDADIVNCHLPAYYRGTANPGAVAKESPVPAIFLTVAAGARLRFRIGRRPGGPRDPEAPEAARRFAEHLEEVGLFAGLGSKTAAGYGYFGV